VDDFFNVIRNLNFNNFFNLNIFNFRLNSFNNLNLVYILNDIFFDNFVNEIFFRNFYNNISVDFNDFFSVLNNRYFHNFFDDF